MKQNHTLYAMQGIACLLVVLIHQSFPGALGVIVTSVARFAVPFFFMVSGFSVYPYAETDSYSAKMRARVRKNATTAALALTVYFLFDLAKLVLKGESVLPFLSAYFAPSSLAKFLLLGVIPPGSGGVLWFLMALLYSYLFITLFPVKKKSIPRNAAFSFAFMVLLGVAKIFFKANPTALFGVDLSSDWIYGNWLAIGLPSVYMGIGLAQFVREKGGWVASRRRVFFLLIPLLLAVNALEALLLDRLWGMYLSYSVFTLTVDFLLFFIAQKDTLSEKAPLAKLGKYLSRDVYLWHPVVISFFTLLSGRIGLLRTGLAQYLLPVVVCVLSVLLSLVIFLAKKKIAPKKNKS